MSSTPSAAARSVATSQAPSADASTAPTFTSTCKDVAFTIALAKPSQDGLFVDGKLANRGAASVALMKTGDGSSFDRRNPTVRFELEPNDVSNPGQCGFINAMEDTDFVTLAPKSSTKLDWLIAPTPGKPGRYTLRAIYRNDPAAKPMRGGEPHSPTPAQLEKLSKTVPCEVTSNALVFEWTGKRATLAR